MLKLLTLKGKESLTIVVDNENTVLAGYMQAGTLSLYVDQRLHKTSESGLTETHLFIPKVNELVSIRNKRLFDAEFCNHCYTISSIQEITEGNYQRAIKVYEVMNKQQNTQVKEIDKEIEERKRALDQEREQKVLALGIIPNLEEILKIMH